METIVVRGARQHNLKGISLEIPRRKLVVVTGPSGSGKTSLVFDTIFAEGQRRFVESLSAYARQFLAQLPKPAVESIEGLSPAIAIDQRNAARNPRSTVGTVTEVNDRLRLLFAHAGAPHCPQCGRAVSAQTVQQMIDRILAWPAGRRFTLLAPIARDRKGSLATELGRLRREGFIRVRIDGEMRALDEEIRVDSRKRHTLEVSVDRIAVKPAVGARLGDSLETALELGDGVVRVVPEDGEEELFSERLACPACGISLPPLEPRLFSFNNPAGACPVCTGLGVELVFDPVLVVADPRRSIRQGAIEPWSKRRGGAGPPAPLLALEEAAPGLGLDLDAPWAELPEASRVLVLEGAGDSLEGVIPWLARRLRELQRRKREEGTSEDEVFERVTEEFQRYMVRRTCTACGGARLRREALAVTVRGENIASVTAKSVAAARGFFAAVRRERAGDPAVDRLCAEIEGRLGFLVEVGLEYLTLERSMATLAGGEAQRIRLATQIGAGLVGVLYVLDEPSVGLHQRDTHRLLVTLRRLVELGNTVLVVEHDRETIEAADWVIDMGPGAGVCGGEIVATGTPTELAGVERSATGGYLSGRLEVPAPRQRRAAGRAALVLRGARGRNLASLDVTFPLGLFICVTGVSGAGKSSLVIDTLLPELRRRLVGSREPDGEPFDALEGAEHVDKVVDIDQAPIGRTSRSNPATYTGAFTTIREIFASLPDARARGYGADRFSFNVKGGRCEACQGEGTQRVEMHFLPDIHVVCDQCNGARYNRETLEIRSRGKNVAEVLDLSIDAAVELFANVQAIQRKLSMLQSVGLGYLGLGQSATTLSGGEAQRIKLAKELSRRETGRTFYVLDEPTTGLHFEDVRRLVEVLQRLVDDGNTVLVIEHNLEVIKCADWVIDLGPEGGEGGGRLVAVGPPEAIAATPASHTGRYLKRLLLR